MQKYYVVDDELRKSLIKQMKKIQMPKMFIWMLLYYFLYIVAALVFIVPTIYVVPMAVEAFCEGYVAEGFGVLSIVLLAFCISMFSFLVPYGIHYLSDKKYMRKWTARSSESVRLQSNSILWSHYDRFIGKSYWDYQIKYQDIERLVYDSKHKIFYVYGYMSGKEWDSINRHRCMETIAIDRNLTPMPWMTLPAYFENFMELKQLLSEASGKVIEEI